MTDKKDQSPQPAPKQGGVEVYTLLDKYLKDTAGEKNDYLRHKLTERYDFGKKKYGIGLCTENGRDTVRDAEEEVLDLIYYLVSCIHTGKNIDNIKMMIQTVNDIILNKETEIWRNKQNEESNSALMTLGRPTTLE